MSNAQAFRAGFASRATAPAHLLDIAFAPAPPGFAPRQVYPPKGGEAGPKHFHPADRDANPTEGWDMLDPAPVAESFVDPIEAAHGAGFAEGAAAARAELTEGAARDRALIEALVADLNSGDRVDRDRIARQLRQTVLLLVTRVIGETGVSGDLLAGRIEAAADMLADSAESALLRVHPDDVALLEGKLPQTIFAAGDAAIARGSFVLESASTVVEDGPELWLEQLAQAIDRVPVPKC
ncbi:Flagellar biosynthesis protein FliH [Sphingomonas sp. EC-HK361]|jgi:flagellar assembly protein FliH|uniref:FliH/SctL family protein n=1 Tax=Sphingomonas sp. EC-HK361 TaxID=2038397 RepID=UPI0012524DAF|nr:FliH/SctL family protein [Sphingomonas sp. EC-HK361]VVT20694.1 Flagellar biosynthesis protein FliH [Sphingomonas sp. EC-HK361]